VSDGSIVLWHRLSSLWCFGTQHRLESLCHKSKKDHRSRVPLALVRSYFVPSASTESVALASPAKSVRTRNWRATAPGFVGANFTVST
jgi:hypothetical protein